MHSTMPAHDAAIGLPTHYGVAVTYLGEDGDQLLAFTDDPRRALAAWNRQVRQDCGMGEFGEQFDPTTVRVVWRVFHNTCGCHHPDTECIDHDCPRPGLPPCSDEQSWWVSGKGVTSRTPGAVEVCLVEQS